MRQAFGKGPGTISLAARGLRLNLAGKQILELFGHDGGLLAKMTKDSFLQVRF